MTTEELKREMYKAIQYMNLHRLIDSPLLASFEDSLEAYLEALRKDATSEGQRLTETIRYNAVLCDAYAHQQGLTRAACVEARQAWDETYELKGKVQSLSDANNRGCNALLKLQEESIELRNKLQAFQFANKSAGEFLQESNRLLAEARGDKKRMRQSIGQLKSDRNNAQANEARLRVDNARLRKELSEARKTIVGTSAQNASQNVAGVELRAVSGVAEVYFRHRNGPGSPMIEEVAAKPKCGRCHGSGFEVNAATGAYAGPCHKCGERLGVLK